MGIWSMRERRLTSKDILVCIGRHLLEILPKLKIVDLIFGVL